jgi:hypothetical protein
MKLTTHLHRVPKLRIMKPYVHSPIYLHGVMFNKLGTGATLPLHLLLQKLIVVVVTMCVPQCVVALLNRVGNSSSKPVSSRDKLIHDMEYHTMLSSIGKPL